MKYLKILNSLLAVFIFSFFLSLATNVYAAVVTSPSDPTNKYCEDDNVRMFDKNDGDYYYEKKCTLKCVIPETTGRLDTDCQTEFKSTLSDGEFTDAKNKGEAILSTLSNSNKPQLCVNFKFNDPSSYRCVRLAKTSGTNPAPQTGSSTIPEFKYEMPTPDKPMPIACQDNPVLPPACTNCTETKAQGTTTRYYYKWETFCGDEKIHHDPPFNPPQFYPPITCTGGNKDKGSPDCMNAFLKRQQEEMKKNGTKTCDPGKPFNNPVTGKQETCPRDGLVKDKDGNIIVPPDRGINAYEPNNYWCYGFKDNKNYCMKLDSTLNEPDSKLNDPKKKLDILNKLKAKLSQIKLSALKSAESKQVYSAVMDTKGLMNTALELITKCKDQRGASGQFDQLDFTQQDGKAGKVIQTKSRCEIAVVRAYKKAFRGATLATYLALKDKSISGCVNASLGIKPYDFEIDGSAKDIPLYFCSFLDGHQAFYPFSKENRTALGKIIANDDQVALNNLKSKNITQRINLDLRVSLAKGCAFKNFSSSVDLLEECKIPTGAKQ